MMMEMRMMVELQAENAKHAQFWIMPRYKVKAEGDVVQVDDQIVLESAKSPGQFLCVSKALLGQQSVYCQSHELNLSVWQSGFTLYRKYVPSEDDGKKFKVGDPLQLYHKEMDSYLVAEGLFDDELTEDVHLRMRPVDPNNHKTMSLEWNSPLYINFIDYETAFDSEDREALCKLLRHYGVPGKIISLIRCTYQDMSCRIAHAGQLSESFEVKTGVRQGCLLSPFLFLLVIDWIMKTTTADRKNGIQWTLWTQLDDLDFADDLALLGQMQDKTTCLEATSAGTGLKINRRKTELMKINTTANTPVTVGGEPIREARFFENTQPNGFQFGIAAIQEKQYNDAFTVQHVEPELVEIYHYMAGMVPFIQKLVSDSLKEMKNFMLGSDGPIKKRQKLMRNLRIVELLVSLLKVPFLESADQVHLTNIFVEAYNVLYTYLIGDSRKNELYIAKYIDFFLTQFEYKAGRIGLSAAHMVMELIRDNRKIVDRISHNHINKFVELLQREKNYRYLELLSVLCLCDGVSIADNQRYITQVWLKGENKDCVYLTDLGDKIGKTKGVVYVSVNSGNTWTELKNFAASVSAHNM
nr:hypothetical protein BaRGS_016344 [Batillaria attramentaria]